MKNRMPKVNLSNVADAISYLDLGCSGGLDQRWSAIEDRLNFIGLDPNKDECLRLSNQPNSYRSVKYLPYAIAGSDGEHTLYVTDDMYCTSLLKPNSNWLNRFKFKDLFRVKYQETVEGITLNTLFSRENISADIVKLDIQGAELPVLKAGDKFLKNVFLVETESGFCS